MVSGNDPDSKGREPACRQAGLTARVKPDQKSRGLLTPRIFFFATWV
jgi:hypothetical protein